MDEIDDLPLRRTRRRNVIVMPNRPSPNDLSAQLGARIVGQPHAMEKIVPYVRMHQAGLAPEGRPIGIFLLLGPTGTGKTRTVEALAEVLHGTPKNILKVDCGEFQMEHEVAKLVGAPPGYLGHRETQPMLTQAKLTSLASERCNISIVLFDEIEKAAPSMTRLLLGVLDKAALRLGDNNTVNFERTLIFLTSNLGSQGIMKELNPKFGFRGGMEPTRDEMSSRLASIAMSAARRQFSPEFMNRIDAIVTYQPLSEESLAEILEQQLDELQAHILRRLGDRAFRVLVPKKTKSFFLRKGTSAEYGAREIKRTIHRHLMQPLANMIADGLIEPGMSVYVGLSEGDDEVVLKAA
jgi:ATP-dependent Clp protease ATP-binding subunit ClpA